MTQFESQVESLRRRQEESLARLLRKAGRRRQEESLARLLRKAGRTFGRPGSRDDRGPDYPGQPTGTECPSDNPYIDLTPGEPAGE
jgi:hypothetical protein